eukprot:gene11629-12688_t
MTEKTEEFVRDVIAVDVDEVLAQFMPSLVSFHNDVYGSTDNSSSSSPSLLTVDSFFSYEFHKVWGGTPSEAFAKMENFFESIHFKEKIFPIHQAYNILLQLKDDYELHIVTARQDRLQDITRQWIQKYFPNIFDNNIHFGNHYSTSGKSRSKSEMCKAIGAKLLIDDSLVYALQCMKENIPVILFGNYAWNQVNPNIIKDYNPSMIGMATTTSSTTSDHNTSLTTVSTITTTTPSNPPPAKGDGINDDLGNDYRASDVERVDDVKVVKYNGNLFTAPASTISDKIVYRVTDWGKVQQLIYQLFPPKRSLHTSIYKKPVKSLNVFAVQLCSVNDKLQNLQKIQQTLDEISSKHFPSRKTRDPLEQLEEEDSEEEEVNLVCLPECCVFMGKNSEETLSQSETLDFSEGNKTNISPTIELLCDLAKQHHIWLSIGGFPERTPQNEEKMFNTHIMINPSGQIEPDSLYRKIHLFDCPLVQLQESKFTEAGNSMKVLNLRGWKIGLSICYDVRFPSFYQKLREYGDVDLILVPSAFTVPTGKAHWEVLLRARAIETQSYVIAAAQSGRHNEKRESYGHSMIIDPWGSVVGQLQGETSGYCYAKLSKDKVKEIRDKMPVLSHVRKDVYNL